MNTKSWVDVFQGFFSREFMMHVAAFILGGLLLWRHEGSDMGAILVMGSVGSYGINRTTQKVVEAREITKRNVEPTTDASAQSRPSKPTS